jgi:hypothetical protein
MTASPNTLTSSDVRVAAADRILSGADGAPDPETAGRLYGEAAEAGSGAAAERLAVLTAMGVARPADFGKALELLAQSADLGHRPAQKQLALLAGRKDLMARTPKAPIWRKLGAGIDVATLLMSPRARQEHLSPAVYVVESFIPKSFCRWIVDLARDRLSESKVSHVKEGAPRADPMRTAEAASFRLIETDFIVAVVQEKLARLASLPVHWHEPPNLLHYLPGQEYQPHYDFIDPRAPAFRDELNVLGQRVATCLVYLNDDFEGGETAFPRLGWKYRGRPGDMLLFQNVASNGRPDFSSLHAGLPPTRGEKWLLSLWVRNRVQPIV